MDQVDHFEADERGSRRWWRIAWMVFAGLLVAAWIGWSGYTASQHDTDAGIGALVAWPALLAMAALAVAPFAAIVFLVRRRRHGEPAPPSSQPTDTGLQNTE